MNINYETNIKQEPLKAEDDLKTKLPPLELNIPVKNEPIIDDLLPSLTVKNEPINEVTLTETGYNIKIEDPIQNQLSMPSDSFIIYELQTPAISNQIPHVRVDNKLKVKQIVNETIPLNTQINSTQINSLEDNSIQTLAKPSALILAKNNEKNNTASKLMTTSPPVLLNTKLRKRKRIVVPTNLVDKRTRYNIEAATASMKNSSTTSIDTFNGGDKKIINHLIKNKRHQRRLENKAEDFLKESTKVKSGIPLVKPIENLYYKLSKSEFLYEGKETPNEMPLTESCIDSLNNKITTQTELDINSNAILATDLNSPKDISNTPELRVKCLCSLTADISNIVLHTLELRNFFKNMFERTRRLNKKQQRKIKMILLQEILNAEDSVEQGKCCNF